MIYDQTNKRQKPAPDTELNSDLSTKSKKEDHHKKREGGAALTQKKRPQLSNTKTTTNSQHAKKLRARKIFNLKPQKSPQTTTTIQTPRNIERLDSYPSNHTKKKQLPMHGGRAKPVTIKPTKKNDPNKKTISNQHP